MRDSLGNQVLWVSQEAEVTQVNQGSMVSQDWLVGPATRANQGVQVSWDSQVLQDKRAAQDNPDHPVAPGSPEEQVHQGKPGDKVPRDNLDRLEV